MVMALPAYGHQTATFAYPGATLGAMGADASSRAMRSDEEEAAQLRDAELTASYHSAGRLGFDELIDPRETRSALLAAVTLATARRQEAATPKARPGITP
jgi:acetyl-CoA carboxylase carboxyltransferase component